MTDQLEPSPMEIRTIKRVQFGVLSPDEIRAMSVCEVTSFLTYENGIPKTSGLNDLRMGTSERAFNCLTCGGTMTECPGHFGHIELAKPCLHIGFMRATITTLRCVCYHCSALLINEDNKEWPKIKRIQNPQKRFKAIAKLCQGMKKCNGGFDTEKIVEEGDEDDAEAMRRALESKSASNAVPRKTGCGGSLPRYHQEGGFKVSITFPDDIDSLEGGGTDRKRPLAPSRIYEIFKRISDDDCRTLGLDPLYCRPDWFVVTVLAVSPPPVRPAVMFDSMTRSSDDLTYKLADVVKMSNLLKRQEQAGAAEHILNDYADLLQYHVCTMFDNEISGQPQAQQRSGKPIKSIRQRLVGKGGRVRGNLMGKRVDFSARSVITPDPNLGIDQLGVPRSIATNMTYPEIVTRLNIDRMRQLINNGPNVHPGAKFIIRNDGKVVNLKHLRKATDAHLELGYKVERHIQDGDPVIFNRQPSLHKMSMMGHKIKILPWSTFRLNLSCTTPYNADFDGDEMNMHVPQSFATRSEVLNIILCPRQVVSPQANKPVMGIVQDTLLGVMKFTWRDTFLSRDFAFNTLMNLESWDGEVPIPCIVKSSAGPLWSGKQIFSRLLPACINLSQTSINHPDEEKALLSVGDTRVLIEQGELIQGTIDKKTVGSSQGSLIHLIWLEEGPMRCAQMFTEIQKVVNYWLLNTGFSIGIGDCIAPKSTLAEIEAKITKAKDDVDKIIQDARQGKLERQPGLTIMQTFEHEVNGVLNKATDSTGKAVKKQLKSSNNLNCMVSAGSKGNLINICQVIACVGQQNVSGRRIGFGFRNRSLPHFHKDDFGPECKGFVENSYLKGLTPQEFFFHAMGGREGLIDTAVKTAETGYIQRRLVKAMEDVMVRYDSTVRNSLGEIIQFVYGEDGMDGCFIERQSIESLKMNDVTFNRAYEMDITQDADFIEPRVLAELNGTVRVPTGDHTLDNMDPDEFAALKTREVTQLFAEEFAAIKRDRASLRYRVLASGDDNVFLPVNIKRLILNAQKHFHTDVQRVSDLNPRTVIETVNRLTSSTDPKDGLVVIRGTDHLSCEAQNNATALFKVMLRSTFSSKRVLSHYKLNTLSFDWLINQIRDRFYQAQAHPGEMVGSIAAQSIGEPATQMTLNTFHYAGVAAKNVTLGVPRLREIINVAATVKTPSLCVNLPPDRWLDSEVAKAVVNKIEFTTLRSVTEKTEIYYDPDPNNSVVEEDRSFMQTYMVAPDEDFSMDKASPWMLRIILDQRQIVSKDLTLRIISERIDKDWNGDLKCVGSSDNAESLVLQIRFKQEDTDFDDANDDDVFLKKVEENLLNMMELGGIKGISKVFMRKEKRPRFLANGSLNLEDEVWVLDTEGNDLLRVLAVENVDPTTTTSNVVTEMFSVLGIEAARASCLKELRGVIEFDGSYVNYRHLAMLCDTMTFRGHLMAITRHGINRVDSGPLMKCSFEETVEILMDAATHGEVDQLRGVSENIMLGQLAPLGTGSFQLFLNREMLDAHAVEDAVIDPNAHLHDVESGVGYSSASIASPLIGFSSPGQQFDQDSLSPGAQFSPDRSGGGASVRATDAYTPAYSVSPTSPGYSPTSPAYSPTSPAYSPTSPAYSPTSPAYSPTSPAYSPTSPAYSPTSPAYSPTSPAYSPTSPTYSPNNSSSSSSGHRHQTSPTYSPTSPSYSPTSPTYSPTSPTYSPTSPTYSPTSPTYSPTSPTYSPTSPTYSPTSPTYSPTSPTYSPTSPTYSPTSPTYSPTSPTYSPTSPTYSPTSPSYSPSSPAYSPTSPTYSPTSPSYSPSSSSSSSNNNNNNNNNNKNKNKK